MTNHSKSLLIILWIIGAAVIISGVFMDWLEISVTLADGTERTITASGLELYTKYGDIGMPVDESSPLIYLLIAVSVALLAIIFWKNDENSSIILGFMMLVFLSIMIVAGSMAVDSMIMYADPPSGMNVSGIPEWLSDIVSGDISHATMKESYGYMVSIVGQFISFIAAILYVKKSGTS